MKYTMLLAALVAAFVAAVPQKSNASVLLGATVLYCAYDAVTDYFGDKKVDRLESEQKLIITQTNQNTRDINQLGDFAADWSESQSYKPKAQPAKDNWRNRIFPTTSPLAIGKSIE